MPDSPLPPNISFLGLSAELRSRIYELACVKHKPIRWNRRRLRGVPAICRINRQVRAETLPIFYGNNVFESDNVWETSLFIRRLDPGSLAVVRELKSHGAYSNLDMARKLNKYCTKGLLETALSFTLRVTVFPLYFRLHGKLHALRPSDESIQVRFPQLSELTNVMKPKEVQCCIWRKKDLADPVNKSEALRYYQHHHPHLRIRELTWE